MFYLDGGQFPPEIWRLSLTSFERSLVYRSDEPGFQIGSLALSPAEDTVAFDYQVFDPVSMRNLTRSGLATVRRDGTNLSELVEISEEEWGVYAPTWSPDGSQIAYLRSYQTPGGFPADVSLHVLDVESDRDHKLTDSGGLMDWAPDGDRLAHNGDEHGVHVYDLRTRRSKTLWRDEHLFFGRPAWQPGSETLAVGVLAMADSPDAGAQQGLWLVQTSSGERRKLTEEFSFWPQWDADGTRLVTSRYMGETMAVVLVSWPDGATSTIVEGTLQLGVPAWSDDGGSLLLAIEEKQNESYRIETIGIENGDVIDLAVVYTMRPFATW